MRVMKTAAYDTDAMNQGFRAHMEAVRECYLHRDIQGYLAGYADYYYGIQFDGNHLENKNALRRRLEKEFQRFDLISMEFKVDLVEFAADRGYASLRYVTKLKDKEDGRIMVDERKNLVIGKHQANGSWLLEAKITLHADSRFEEVAEN